MPCLVSPFYLQFSHSFEWCSSWPQQNAGDVFPTVIRDGTTPVAFPFCGVHFVSIHPVWCLHLWWCTYNIRIADCLPPLPLPFGNSSKLGEVRDARTFIYTVHNRGEHRRVRRLHHVALLHSIRVIHCEHKYYVNVLVYVPQQMGKV